MAAQIRSLPKRFAAVFTVQCINLSRNNECRHKPTAADNTSS